MGESTIRAKTISGSKYPAFFNWKFSKEAEQEEKEKPLKKKAKKKKKTNELIDKYI